MPTQNAQILVLCKETLDHAVPILSISQQLSRLGHHVHILSGGCSLAMKTELESHGIRITTPDINEKYSKNKPHGHAARTLSKLAQWLTFRQFVASYLSTHRTNDLIYVAGAETALCLAGTLQHYPHIIHLRELHDQQPHYMAMLNILSRRAAQIVVPEINRAHIYKSMFKLPQVPIVIPNKPFAHPRKPRLDISFLAPEIRDRIISGRNILYQGHLNKERDLSPLLLACRQMAKYNIVIMGQDQGMLEQYRSINPDITHIDFLRPPLHLNVTSWAHIGILTYDQDSLNTIYCAPNKIWEFSGFAVPMLCGENLGLRYTVGQCGAGEIVSFSDPESLCSGLARIEQNYEKVQNNASRLYDSVCFEEAVSQILSYAILRATR